MLQVLIVLQVLLAAVAREFDRVCNAATLATEIRIKAACTRPRSTAARFMEAGLAAAYLLVSHAARESKGEFQVQASQYDSPGLSCPRVPRSRQMKTMAVCQAGTLMGFVWPHTSRISACLRRNQL